jgi:hypothetical protein
VCVHTRSVWAHIRVYDIYMMHTVLTSEMLISARVASSTMHATRACSSASLHGHTTSRRSIHIESMNMTRTIQRFKGWLCVVLRHDSSCLSKPRHPSIIDWDPSTSMPACPFMHVRLYMSMYVCT